MIVLLKIFRLAAVAKFVLLVTLLPTFVLAQKTSKNVSVQPVLRIEQDFLNISPLSVGDKVPDVLLGNIINASITSTSFSLLKGKWVLLDFFATWCGACIQELPHLSSLQSELSGKLQILAIDYEPKAQVQLFLKTNKFGKAATIPFVTGNTTLKKLFPHRLLPHDVLINPEGIVMAITDARQITRDNLTSLINGKTVNFPLKKDDLDFDRSKPLLESGNGGTSERILMQSRLLKRLNGVSAMAGIGMMPDSMSKRMYFINYSILSMIIAATRWEYPNRIIFNVNNNTKFIEANDDKVKWVQEHFYGYELIVPATTSKLQMNQIMLDDVCSFSKVKVRVERVLVDCWILTRLNLLNNSSISQYVDHHGDPSIELSKVPLSNLIAFLNSQKNTDPISPVILDESGFYEPVSLRLFSKKTDLDLISKELENFGFTLKKASRMLDMLLITDADSY